MTSTGKIQEMNFAESYKIVDAPILTLREYVTGIVNCTSRITTLRSNTRKNRNFLSKLRVHLDQVTEEAKKSRREASSAPGSTYHRRWMRMTIAEKRITAERHRVLKKIRLGTATATDEAHHLQLELRYERMVGSEVRRAGTDEQAQELLKTCKKMLIRTIKTISDELENSGKWTRGRNLIGDRENKCTEPSPSRSDCPSCRKTKIGN